MIEETLCPKCKSKMKRAVSKHGAYWRCSRWGCDGTRDVEGRSKEEKDAAKEDGELEEFGDEPRWDR